MTTGFKFEVSLRITHPTIDPIEVTRELSIEPSRHYKAGDGRATPKGTPLPGYYEHSGWFYRLPQNADASLPMVLREMNQKLSKSYLYLESLESTGGTIEYFIGWFSEFNSGEVFDWRLLKECADLRINLVFDVYGENQVATSDITKQS
jgi:hypothetical protein